MAFSGGKMVISGGWGRPSPRRGLPAAACGFLASTGPGLTRLLLALTLGLLFALALAGCTGEDLTYKAPAPPIIIVTPGSIDTVGRPLAYNVYVSEAGGTVKSYSVEPPLPSGITLDTITGLISGTPTEPWPATTHLIIGVGFGGSDTAAITLRVIPRGPFIRYATPLVDTLDRPASHLVLSTGDPVTSYAIDPALPAGLQLQTTTGRIYGTPTAVSPARAYTVTATGPTGVGTTTLTLSVVDPNELPPPPPGDSAGIAASITLGHASGIPLAKLVITATSSVSTDAVVRDTLLAGQGGFAANPGGSQTLVGTVALRPLRSYTVEVKTLDGNDSAIHVGITTVAALAAGETRAVALSIAARYAAYTARITLQGNANDYGAGLDRALTFTRATFVIAGVTVFDTVAAGGSFPVGVRHIGTRYVPADKIDQLKIYVFGTATGWNPALPILSYDTPWLAIPPYTPGTVEYQPLDINTNYTGPGSDSEP